MIYQNANERVQAAGTASNNLVTMTDHKTDVNSQVSNILNQQRIQQNKQPQGKWRITVVEPKIKLGKFT